MAESEVIPGRSRGDQRILRSGVPAAGNSGNNSGMMSVATPSNKWHEKRIGRPTQTATHNNRVNTTVHHELNLHIWGSISDIPLFSNAHYSIPAGRPICDRT